MPQNSNRKIFPVLKSAASVVLCTAFFGCASIPNNLLVLPGDYLTAREQQMRKYATTDEKQVLQASAAALQDLGFTVDKSEFDLGVIVTSKNRSAVSVSQTALALTADIAGALVGGYSNLYGQTNKEQKIQASVVINQSLTNDATVVRVKFQRIIWNQMGQVSRFETMKDPELYQGFFERVSKSIFLEEQKI